MKFLNNSQKKCATFLFIELVVILANAYGEIYCFSQEIQTDEF
jgi:hypothetical protein